MKRSTSYILIYFILIFTVAVLASCSTTHVDNVESTTYDVRTTQYLTYKVRRTVCNKTTIELDSLVTSNTSGDTIHHTVFTSSYTTVEQ